MAKVDLPHFDLAAACLEPADVEKPFYQSGERVCLLVDRFQDLALAGRDRPVDALLEQIEIADDDVDRRLQLVGRNGNKFRTQALQLRELTGHGVIAGGKATELRLLILGKLELMA